MEKHIVLVLLNFLSGVCGDKMKTFIIAITIAVSLSACQIGRVNQCNISKYESQLNAGLFKGCWTLGR